MVRKPTFISLFAGCGGFDLGFEQAGFRGIAAFDNDPEAVRVHNANLDAPAYLRDLSADFLDSHSIAIPDVVIAGPPCQGFSTVGRRNVDDPRNHLLTRAAELAIAMRPRVFVLENVRGVASGAHRRYWDHAQTTLQDDGFRIQVYECLSQWFGVPQIRRRMVLLAVRDGGKLPASLPTSPISSLKRTLGKVERAPNHDPTWLKPSTAEFKIASHIGPHQKLSNVRAGARAVHTWQIPEVFGATTSQERDILSQLIHLRRRHRARSYGDADPLSASLLRTIFGSDGLKQIVTLHTKGYLRRVGKAYDLAHTFNGKFRRLSWDAPAPAVDTRFGQPRYFLHPDDNRGLSVREAARIQGFPDSFVFDGSRQTQYRLVGNAVPPPLAKSIATVVKQLI